jgi:hypothetical protein
MVIERHGDESRRRILASNGKCYNTILLQSAVEDLKAEIRHFNQRIDVLQRQVDEQSGQLKILSNFVDRTLHERVGLRIEEAVKRTIDRRASKAGRRKKTPE